MGLCLDGVNSALEKVIITPPFVKRLKISDVVIFLLEQFMMTSCWLDDAFGGVSVFRRRSQRCSVLLLLLLCASGCVRVDELVTP